MVSAELQETAGLARLGLGEEELQAVSPAFEQMLSFLDVMQGSDTAMPSIAALSRTEAHRAEGSPLLADFVAASARPAGSGCLRPDVVQPEAKDITESMLSQAPEREGTFIVIPNVL